MSLEVINGGGQADSPKPGLNLENILNSIPDDTPGIEALRQAQKSVKTEAAWLRRADQITDEDKRRLALGNMLKTFGHDPVEVDEVFGPTSDTPPAID